MMMLRENSIFLLRGVINIDFDERKIENYGLITSTLAYG